MRTGAGGSLYRLFYHRMFARCGCAGLAWERCGAGHCQSMQYTGHRRRCIENPRHFKKKQTYCLKIDEIHAIHARLPEMSWNIYAKTTTAAILHRNPIARPCGCLEKLAPRPDHRRSRQFIHAAAPISAAAASSLYAAAVSAACPLTFPLLPTYNSCRFSKISTNALTETDIRYPEQQRGSSPAERLPERAV